MAWDSIRARIDKYRPRAAAPWRSTMTEPATSPTAIPTITPTRRGPTREQLYPELITATLAWRNHARCGTNPRCRREHAEWIDMLLDEWLDAPA